LDDNLALVEMLYVVNSLLIKQQNESDVHTNLTERIRSATTDSYAAGARFHSREQIDITIIKMKATVKKGKHLTRTTKQILTQILQQTKAYKFVLEILQLGLNKHIRLQAAFRPGLWVACEKKLGVGLWQVVRQWLELQCGKEVE
jgi:hypothetical protein